MPENKFLDGHENKKEVEVFFDKWGVYKKAMDHNYMYHKQAYMALRKYIDDSLIRYTFLDLGCGDAEYTAKYLKSSHITYYHAIDLSGTALDLAKSNMHIVSCEKVFTLADLIDFIDFTEEHFDFIWIGLSLHHLTSKDKEPFFSKVKKLLNKGGSLIVYDPFLKKDESLEDFVDRWTETALLHWNALTKDELESLCRHVKKDDFPESYDTYEKIARKNGFRDIQVLFEDIIDIYKVIAFR